MHVTNIKSQTHAYNIYVGENLRYNVSDYLPKHYSTIFIITDETVAPYYLEDVKAGLAQETVVSSVIPSGESSKNINIFYELHTKAIEYGLDRQSLIIALGGGVIGDIAGFVAATYMRGIDYIQMPTTILAHDSSVGGKVALNHEQGKNMIGNFHAPVAVIYDVTTLSTLHKQEIRSGYAELLKESLLADFNLYKSIIATNLAALSNEILSKQLLDGINIKANIVESDEHEINKRKFLNLGHTLGHALEITLTNRGWTHGELVAIGILFSIKVSEKIFDKKFPYNEIHMWLKGNNFPLQWPSIDINTVFKKMKHDKKNTGDIIQMVLLKDIGHPVLYNISDSDMLGFLQDFANEITINQNKGGKSFEK